jgi:hypothetical protein
MTRYEQIQYGMLGMKSAPKKKIVKIDEPKPIKEVDVHNMVCKYIKAQYPNVMFISDFAAGIKMSVGMASRMKLQRSNHSFPDLMILEPRNGYHGLFIELKRDKDQLLNKDGSRKLTDHLKSQQAAIISLEFKGYYATFACGFDEAKNIIDNYLFL